MPDQDDLEREFEVEMPEPETLDGHLDDVLPMLRGIGEDLSEDKHQGIRWLEIREELNFHEAVLHIFQDGGEYLKSTDGNISTGIWSTLDHKNTLILDIGMQHELFDLQYLDDDFMILKKHGNQARRGKRKYVLFVREAVARNLEWREIVELLHNKYDATNNTIYYVMVVIVILIILASTYYR